MFVVSTSELINKKFIWKKYFVKQNEHAHKNKFITLIWYAQKHCVSIYKNVVYAVKCLPRVVLLLLYVMLTLKGGKLAAVLM